MFLYTHKNMKSFLTYTMHTLDVQIL